MSKVLTSLPVGERVGIAFSGGLDTSVAVAWMREKGAVPCTYTADIGQYDEPDIDVGARPRRASTAPRSPALVDCRAALVEEGLAALACGAFHIRSGGRAYFNTTPLGRAVTGTLLVRAMLEDDVQIWGDGSTFKGNDIERFYRYGLLANPSLRIYKPWLDADFVTELGGRKEMSEWLLARDLPYRDSTEKAYSTDANIWGATHEAKSLEHLDTGIEIVEPIMGVRFWDPSVEIAAEDVTVALRAGPAGDDQRQGVRLRRSTWCWRPTRSAAGTAWACPTRSRTGSSRPRAAASTRPRAWRCCTPPTSGWSTRIHNEDTLASYHNEGRRLGRLMYEGRWLDPQALMLRESLQRWVGTAVTGEVTLRLRRGEDYSILDTTGPAFSYHPDKLSMERTEDAAFGPVGPDRPADHAQPRHRRLPGQAGAVRRAGHGRQRAPGAHRRGPGRLDRADRRDGGRRRARPSRPAGTRDEASRARTSCWTGPRWSPAPTDHHPTGKAMPRDGVAFLTSPVPSPDVCCSSDEAEFTGTTLYVGRRTHPEHGLIHVLGYQNTGRQPGRRPERHAAAPAGGRHDRRQPGADRPRRRLLDRIAAALPVPTDGIEWLGDDSVRVFEHDIYTMVLAADATALPSALHRVEPRKRPRLADALLAFYTRHYPRHVILLCCFDNAEAQRAKPLLLWYRPQEPDLLVAPAIDSHTGAPPDLDAPVAVDHRVAFGTDDAPAGWGRPVRYAKGMRHKV